MSVHIDNKIMTAKYVFALVLLAMLAFSAYFGMLKMIETEGTSAAIINKSGRQRMLSQRIAFLAELIVDTHERDARGELRKELLNKIIIMENLHDWLINGNKKTNQPGSLSQDIRAIYFEPPILLDKQIRSYLENAKILVATPDTELTNKNPHLRYILSVASSELLVSLEKLVEQYQLESELGIENVGRFQVWVLAITLITLLMMGLLLFRPMVRNVMEKTQELISAENKTRAIIATIGEGIITIGQDSRIRFVNQELCNIFGYTKDELRNQYLQILMPEKYRALHGAGMTGYAGKGISKVLGQRVELEGLRKDGSIFPVELRVEETKIEESGEKLFTAAIRDITERKQAEKEIAEAYHEVGKSYKEVAQTVQERTSELAETNKELMKEVRERKEAEEKLFLAEKYARNILDSSLDMIITVDKERKVVQFNRAAQKNFGYKKDEVIGKDVTILYADPEGSQVLVENLEEKGHFYGEVLNRRKNGKIFTAFVSGSRILDEDGSFLGTMGISRDISEEKILRVQLSQAQKLESIGSLAAGIAHEINTPIQFIGDNIRFLEGSFSDIDKVLTVYSALLLAGKSGKMTDEIIHDTESAIEEADMEFLQKEIPDSIEASLRGVERVATIVKAMKEFSHPGTKEKTPINLNSAIESTITVSRNEWKYVADLETDFDESLPLVPCLPDDFNQVILNLITNAAFAIGDLYKDGSESKGKIIIKTCKAGDYAEITVSDNGSGIPESIKEKIYDPFFTTKEVGKGTGQGLSISHSIIVDKHSGTISFDSEKGKGTTFKIRLPLTGGNGN